MVDLKALHAAMAAIRPRFQSANRIPVQKALVPREEWERLEAAISAAPVAPTEHRRLVDGTPLGNLLRWQERRIADLTYMLDRAASKAPAPPAESAPTAKP